MSAPAGGESATGAAAPAQWEGNAGAPDALAAPEWESADQPSDHESTGSGQDDDGHWDSGAEEGEPGVAAGLHAGDDDDARSWSEGSPRAEPEGSQQAAPGATAPLTALGGVPAVGAGPAGRLSASPAAAAAAAAAAATEGPACCQPGHACACDCRCCHGLVSEGAAPGPCAADGCCDRVCDAWCGVGGVAGLPAPAAPAPGASAGCCVTLWSGGPRAPRASTARYTRCCGACAPSFAAAISNAAATKPRVAAFLPILQDTYLPLVALKAHRLPWLRGLDRGMRLAMGLLAVYQLLLMNRGSDEGTGDTVFWITSAFMCLLVLHSVLDLASRHWEDTVVVDRMQAHLRQWVAGAAPYDDERHDSPQAAFSALVGALEAVHSWGQDRRAHAMLTAMGQGPTGGGGGGGGGGLPGGHAPGGLLTMGASSPGAGHAHAPGLLPPRGTEGHAVPHLSHGGGGHHLSFVHGGAAAGAGAGAAVVQPVLPGQHGIFPARDTAPYKGRREAHYREDSAV